MKKHIPALSDSKKIPMTPDEKNGIMTEFGAGKIDILVSTTVIEVISRSPYMIIASVLGIGVALMTRT